MTKKVTAASAVALVLVAARDVLIDGQPFQQGDLVGGVDPEQVQIAVRIGAVIEREAEDVETDAAAEEAAAKASRPASKSPSPP